MYPDLSYVFSDLFGSAQDNWTSMFKCFGLMLGVAFLASGLLVKSELTRLEKEGKVFPTKTTKRAGDSTSDIIINAVILGILAAKLPFIFRDFSSFAADPAAILFSKTGYWLLGLLVGGSMAAYLIYKRSKIEGPAIQEFVVQPHQKTMDIIIVAAISGVIGAKLFSILENLEDFFRDPLGQFFSGSGLTVYGGIILAFIMVYRYVNANGIKPIYMMDIAGMGILLGYGIGRIGCQLAGDGDWGIVAGPQPSWWFLPDWLWSQAYTHNVANEGNLIAGCDENVFRAAQGAIEERCKTACGIRYCHTMIDNKVFPTPIYETVLSFIGFGLLYAFRKKIKIAGILFFFYMIYNGIERFFIEQIRVNEKYTLAGLNFSQAQYISIVFVIVGTIGAVYLVWRHKNAEKQQV